MKYAKKRVPYSAQSIDDWLLDAFCYCSPFGGGILDMLDEAEEEISYDELPETIERKISSLASIAYAQIECKLPPPNTWAAGLGRGFLRQDIARKIEDHWRTHDELPSGPFVVERYGAVELPIEDAEKNQ